MTVVNEPPIGTVANDTVIYGQMSGPSGRQVQSNTYIAFGVTDGEYLDAKAATSIALHLGPVMIGHALDSTWYAVIFWLIAALWLIRSRDSNVPLWVPVTVHEWLTGEQLRREPAGTTSTSAVVLLAIGWVLLVTTPFIGIFGSGRFVPPAIIGMILALWTGLGFVGTFRECWAALLGIACAPVAIVLPLTPITNVGDEFLALSIGSALLIWPAIGMLCYYLARTAQNWNVPTTSPRND